MVLEMIFWLWYEGGQLFRPHQTGIYQNHQRDGDEGKLGKLFEIRKKRLSLQAKLLPFRS